MKKMSTYINTETKQRCMAISIHQAAEKLKVTKDKIKKITLRIG